MRQYLLAAAAVIIPSSAQAATYVFASGTYQSGVTSPNPLLSPDILSITGTDAKVFGTGTFTNQSGRVNWSGGDIFFGGGTANVFNNSLWNATGNDQITFFSGGGTFTNAALFQKTASSGTTTIGINNFVNSGTIDAQTGIIRIDSGGGNVTFNAGTAFTGAGTVSLTDNSATFNGAFTSTNLDFAGNGYIGNAASLTGTADFLSGVFRGGWSLTAGSTLNLAGAGQKSFGTGTFDNDGTLAWSGGTIALTGAGSNLVNDGLMVATSNDIITPQSGIGGFTNNGTFVKSGGTGTTGLIDSNLDNNGTMDVQSGTIALPRNFVNDGTMAGTGTFALDGTLTNGGTIAPGNGGTTVGTLNLTGNYLQAATGRFAAQIGGTGVSDLFAITGTAQLGGTLALSCFGGCAFGNGDIFTLLDSVGQLTGTFGNVTTSGFLNGFSYDVIYDYTASRVQLRVNSAGVTPPVNPGGVPEPATWAMMLLGFGSMGYVMRRPTTRTRIRFA